MNYCIIVHCFLGLTNADNYYLAIMAFYTDNAIK